MLGSVSMEWLCNAGDPSDKAGRGRAPMKASPGSSRQGVSSMPEATLHGTVSTTRSERAVGNAGEDDHLVDCVRAMMERDQLALGRLYNATCARVHGVVLRIVRRPELAEEVLADVYHQAWRDCHRYDPMRGKVIAWLLIMGRTRSLDALRRADEAFSHPSPEDLLAPEALMAGDEDPLGLLDAARGNAMLHDALESLSPVQRQLIALAFFKGLSHAEIAAHTRLPLGSVKTHIRKALLQLRDVLAGT